MGPSAGSPTTCGDGSDNSIIPGTTESCGSNPDAIVKFDALSTT